MSHYSKNNPGLPVPVQRAGFTLVEFLVSIGIVFVILTLVISKQSIYTEKAALTNLADDISLSIFQSQAYGVGVREFSQGTSIFNVGYGLTFSLLASGSNIAFLYFADRNGNYIYDGDWTCSIGGASECLNKTAITRGNYIDSLCVVRTSGADLCNVGRVDISFVRPNTEAQLRFFSNGGNPYSPANIAGAKIGLKSSSGATVSVVVYTSGQISVQ